jgi:hypothetical protein
MRQNVGDLEFGEFMEAETPRFETSGRHERGSFWTAFQKMGVAE